MSRSAGTPVLTQEMPGLEHDKARSLPKVSTGMTPSTTLVFSSMSSDRLAEHKRPEPIAVVVDTDDRLMPLERREVVPFIKPQVNPERANSTALLNMLLGLPWWWGLSKKEVDDVQNLLTKGEDPNQEKPGVHAGELVVMLPYSVEILEALINHGLHPYRRRDGKTIILYEIAKNIFYQDESYRQKPLLAKKMVLMRDAYTKPTIKVVAARSDVAPKLVRHEITDQGEVVHTDFYFNDGVIINSQLMTAEELDKNKVKKSELYTLYTMCFVGTSKDEVQNRTDVFDEFCRDTAVGCNGFVEIIYAHDKNGVNPIAFNIFKAKELKDKHLCIYTDAVYIKNEYGKYGIMPYIFFRPSFGFQHLYPDHAISIAYYAMTKHSWKLVRKAPQPYLPKHQSPYLMDLAVQVFGPMFGQDKLTLGRDGVLCINESSHLEVSKAEESRNPNAANDFIERFYETRLRKTRIDPASGDAENLGVPVLTMASAQFCDDITADNKLRLGFNFKDDSAVFGAKLGKVIKRPAVVTGFKVFDGWKAPTVSNDDQTTQMNSRPNQRGAR